jgi:TPR repeat protein
LEVEGGKQTPLYGYMTYQPQKARYEDFKEAGVELFFCAVYVGDRGINPNSGTRPFRPGFWKGYGEYDFSWADEDFRRDNFIKAAELGSTYAYIYEWLGWHFANEAEDPAQAEMYFAKAAELGSDKRMVYEYLGDAAAAAGAEASVVRDYYLKAEELGSDYAPAYAWLAGYYADAEPDAERARACYEKAAALGSEAAHVYEYLAAMTAGEDMAAACGYYLQAAEAGSQNPLVYEWLGRWYSDGGEGFPQPDEEKARLFYEMAAEKGSGNLAVYEYLGASYGSGENIDAEKARRYCNAAIEMGSESALMHESLGRAALADGAEASEACAHFLAAVEKGSSAVDVYEWLGWHCITDEHPDPDMARAHYETAAALGSENAQVYIYLASKALKEKETAETNQYILGHMLRAAELDTDSVLCYEWLGWYYNTDSELAPGYDPARARGYLEQAVVLGSEHAYVHEWLGIIGVRSGGEDAATKAFIRDHFLRAAELESEYSYVYEWLGWYYEGGEEADPDRSRRYYLRAAKLGSSVAQDKLKDMNP